MARCIDCGLLAIADEETAQSRIAPDQLREKGYLLSADGRAIETRVFCHRGSDAFPSDLPVHSPGELVEKLSAENDCKLFRRWIKGKSPQEHEEMSILERLQLEHEIAHLDHRRHYRHHFILTSVAVGMAATALMISIWNRTAPPQAGSAPSDVTRIEIALWAISIGLGLLAVMAVTMFWIVSRRRR